MKKFMKIVLPVAAALTAVSIILVIALKQPVIYATDLMEGITPEQVQGTKADDKFINAAADFSVEMFKNGVTENENSLISPLSLLLALSMTANGAGEITLEQMESVLGGGMDINDLNKYLYQYIKDLPNTDETKFKSTNSIWFRDDEKLNVEQSFLQTNADYYGAGAYQRDFSSNKAVSDINNWVKLNTDSMIDKIIDKIDPDTVMYLINAVIFDAKWQNVYKKEDVNKDDFKNVDGTTKRVDFMHSNEYRYLSDDNTSGFSKLYYGGKYKFIALLPDENTDINNYVLSLTGDKFMNLVKNEQQEVKVSAFLPKFSYEYKIILNDSLIDMGIEDAFDSGKADFSKLGKSSDGNIYIGEVLHKTYIQVDELGTKAGAVSSVGMKAASAAPDEPKVVKLDRPFVYAIVDSDTNLPIFIGTVMKM